MVIEPERHPDGTLALTDSQRTLLGTRGHESCQVHAALLKLYDAAKQFEENSARENNLPSCPSCGETTFIATGNCHVCATCGESQGCS